MSVKQLEAVFKKFGPIKKGGIQVRNFAVCFRYFVLECSISIFPYMINIFGNFSDQDGFCYGFVEFELSKSACSAIEVLISNCY